MRTAETGPWESDEAQLHLRFGALRHFQCGLQGCKTDRGRQLLVRCRHLRHLVKLPVFHHQVGPGIDDPGRGHYQCPAQGHDAQQVMHIQPPEFFAALVADIAKIQFAHERGIQYQSGNNGQQQQHAHQPQEQHARQSGKQVHMQLEHHIQKALLRQWLTQHLRSTRIQHHLPEATVCICTRPQTHHPLQRLIVLTVHILRHQVRIAGAGSRQQSIHTGRRAGVCDLRRFNMVTNQVMDLMTEDQWQPGQA